MNEHNGLVPRDHWIEEWERQSVIDYFNCHPLDGYRRLTFMMLDEDVVAVPSINSSCMRLANFLQPECFGRLHVGRFKSRRRLYSGVEV